MSINNLRFNGEIFKIMYQSSQNTNYVLFVFRLIVMLVISDINFDGGTLVLIASVPGHCSSLTFLLAYCEYLSIIISESFWLTDKQWSNEARVCIFAYVYCGVICICETVRVFLGRSCSPWHGKVVYGCIARLCDPPKWYPYD